MHGRQKNPESHHEIMVKPSQYIHTPSFDVISERLPPLNRQVDAGGIDPAVAASSMCPPDCPPSGSAR